MRILVIDIDSLRPDRLGCYGYERDTSPTIDAIASEGVRFERCYASDTPCLPSRTALATCRFGLNTGVVTHYGEGQRYDEPGDGHDPDADRLPAFRHLAENGIYTASVSSFSQRHMASHFSASFQESIQPTANAGTLAVEDCSDVTPVAERWLDQHAEDDDWLLHVNYWDVHHPYLGIEPFLEAVRDSGPAAQWPDADALADQRGMTGVRCTDLWPAPAQYGPNWEDDYDWQMPERVTSRDDVEQFVDGYDASIRRVDAEVSKLLAALERHGVRNETAIIVTADHGEAFGEHGIYAEHAFPHPPCQQVPLVVSWPGVTDEAASRSVDSLVYQFDLMPTICELADVAVPGSWDAQTFTPALRGEDFSGREFIVSGHGIYTFGRAVYTERWMYVRLLHPGVFTYPELYNDPSMANEGLELLHDFETDPHMERNLVASHPERTKQLRQTLDRWLAKQLSDDWRAQRPARTRGQDTLVRMCAAGPYLYVDPDALCRLYDELDRTERQRDTLRRTIDAFPRASQGPPRT